jgi:hypothetical protein
MNKQTRQYEGLLRVLIYPIQFAVRPLDDVERVISDIIPNNGVSTCSQDYISAVEWALEKGDELSKLIPQPHSEKVIRTYLAEVQRRLGAR